MIVENRNIEKVMNVFEDVKKFHKTFGHAAPDKITELTKERIKVRAKWINEEINEFINANNITQEIDAMVDCMYFIIGTLIEMGAQYKVIEELNKDDYSNFINEETLPNQINGNLTLIFNYIKTLVSRTDISYSLFPKMINDNDELLHILLNLVDEYSYTEDYDTQFKILMLMFKNVILICAYMGIDPSYPFELVQKANMSKIWEDGKVHYNEDNKVIKPKNWVAPDKKIKEYLEEVINKNQYDHNIEKLNNINNEIGLILDNVPFSEISNNIINKCKDIIKELNIQPEIYCTFDGFLQLQWKNNEIFLNMRIENENNDFYIDLLKDEKIHDTFYCGSINEVNNIINKYKDYLMEC